jgi:hypothetical protein
MLGRGSLASSFKLHNKSIISTLAYHCYQQQSTSAYKSNPTEFAPRVSETGIPFLAPDSSIKIGKDLAYNRIEFKSDKVVKNHLKKLYQIILCTCQYRLCNVPRNTNKSTSGQKDSIRKAYNKFLVPADMKAIFI